MGPMVVTDCIIVSISLVTVGVRATVRVGVVERMLALPFLALASPKGL